MTSEDVESRSTTDVHTLRKRIMDAVNLVGYPVSYLRITLESPSHIPTVEVKFEADSTDYIPRKTDHVQTEI